MRFTVFVQSIKRNVVEASNGGPDGPPFIRFELPPADVQKCHIDKSYLVTIEELTDN